MGSKKKTPITSGTNLQTLKIGSCVRCTDDRVEGRIIWANGVSVKIRWEDGKQVTWRRDSLGSRPIEILDAEEPAAAELQAEPIAIPTIAEEATAEEEASVITPEPIAEMSPLERTPDAPLSESTPAEPTGEPVDATEAAVPGTGAAEAAAADHAPPATEPKARRKIKQSATVSGSEKKPSALDGAAKVLAEAGTAMTCQEMIETMAAKGYWTSPGGKTPQSTLYSAICREITAKGNNSRFVKAERGKFARTGAA